METETKSGIIDATNRVLCDHGYAGLTIQRVADESSRNAFLDAVFTPTNPGAEGFPVAVMELKSQVPFQELFRERFLDLDETRRLLENTLELHLGWQVRIGGGRVNGPGERARVHRTSSPGVVA